MTESTELPWGSIDDAPPGVQILDLEKEVNANAQSGIERDLSLARVSDMCTKTGFLYIINHGISEDHLDDFTAATQSSLHNLTSDQYHRLSNASPDKFGVPRGLTGTGHESTAKVLNTGTSVDYCTKYTWGVNGNSYPDQDFRDRMDKMFASIQHISITLLRLLCEALSIDSAVCEAMVKDSQGILRFLDYPDVPEDSCSSEEEVVLRMGAHPDLDVITVLYQRPCPNGFVSLQAMINGEWTDIPAIRNTFVINFGEVLTAVSGDRVPATYHRVVSPRRELSIGSARVSFPFFWNPRPDFRMPIPKDSKFSRFLKEGETSTTFGKFLGDAVRTIQSKSINM